MPSKSKATLAVSDHDAPSPPPTLSERSVSTRSRTSGRNDNVAAAPVHDVQVVNKKLKIFIVFYSMYRHVESLARRMKEGVDAVEGVEGFLYRVPETLAPEALEQMKVPRKDDGIPVISVDELVEADGLLFGFPTRYGSMAAQMKAFFDSTGSLWREQKLAGIPAGFFVSTGTQGGGQETTA